MATPTGGGRQWTEFARSLPPVGVGEQARVRETFELSQLKSAPSQLNPVFFQDLTGCKLVAIHLDLPMSSIFLLAKCRLMSSSLLWQPAKNLGIDKEAKFSV